MAPRGSRGRSVSPADARAYLAKAESWLEAASESLEVRRWDVAAGSAVTAGINACDAVLGSLLGQRAGGEHAQAIDWLQGAGADGRSAAHQLSQLLRYKTPAQYAHVRAGRPQGRRDRSPADRASRGRGRPDRRPPARPRT